MPPASPSFLPHETAQNLLEEAKAIATQAYAPYSHFHVGAAVLLENGEIITGANVENISFPLGICAETVALSYAKTHSDASPIALAVWGQDAPHGAVTPCGGCRQVMAEHLSPESPIVLIDTETGHLQQTAVQALLPGRFQF